MSTNKMEEFLLDEDFYKGCDNFEKEFNLRFNKKEDEWIKAEVNS